MRRGHDADRDVHHAMRADQDPRQPLDGQRRDAVQQAGAHAEADRRPGAVSAGPGAVRPGAAGPAAVRPGGSLRSSLPGSRTHGPRSGKRRL